MKNFQENVTSTITEQIQSATTAVNDANTRVLDAVVETNKNVVDFAVKTAERLPTVSLPRELPVALPTPAEAGEQYLDFVERAVSMNRDFSDRVAGMLPSDVQPTVAKKAAAPKAAAKSTKKAAAKSTKKAAAKSTKKAAAAAK